MIFLFFFLLSESLLSFLRVCLCVRDTIRVQEPKTFPVPVSFSLIFLQQTANPPRKQLHSFPHVLSSTHPCSLLPSLLRSHASRRPWRSSHIYSGSRSSTCKFRKRSFCKICSRRSSHHRLSKCSWYRPLCTRCINRKVRKKKKKMSSLVSSVASHMLSKVVVVRSLSFS